MFLSVNFQEWAEGEFGEEYYEENEGQYEGGEGYGEGRSEEHPQNIPPEIAPDVSLHFGCFFFFARRFPVGLGINVASTRSVVLIH